MIKALDVFSREPVSLTFGSQRDPKTKGLWRTSFGGCTTIGFLAVLVLYIMSATSALFSGDNDMNEDTIRKTKLYVNASLSLN